MNLDMRFQASTAVQLKPSQLWDVMKPMLYMIDCSLRCLQ